MAAHSDRVVFAFGTGEVHPLYGARSDVEKFTGACRTLQNMTLGVFGYAERRAGLQFIARVAPQANPPDFLLVATQLFLGLPDLRANVFVNRSVLRGTLGVPVQPDFMLPLTQLVLALPDLQTSVFGTRTILRGTVGTPEANFLRYQTQTLFEAFLDLSDQPFTS